MTENEIKAKLQERFNDTSGLAIKGTAFINVSVIGPDNIQYGSYQIIRESSLIGRDVKYEWYDGKPAIIVLDSDYNPKTFKWSNPLHYNNKELL